ncbi:preprotein translocase subunit [Oryzomicrobium terrae]|jgi:preprotein translocase subunit SecB|uniref:Protein-export protein SecB n=1 Tax=Oryzomicrobium terrae TaxID=1735038 RepID=A0A5C1E5P5_9RHOO|nr:protein-export chaperone SecB [Oryzomicrobium terrae]QEL63975.1 preprotein translocase subunit [Oryzomicrobium terrae]
MSEQVQPSFAIEKLYVKDLSVEVPGAPEVFLAEEGPEVEIKLHSEGRGLGNNFFDVALTVTVTARRDDKTAFLVEVTQAGIFRIEGVPEDQLEPLLAVACPNILFPYAREVMSDATTRAGFAPVILSPVNFEALYMSRLQEQAEQGEGSLQ